MVMKLTATHAEPAQLDGYQTLTDPTVTDLNQNATVLNTSIEIVGNAVNVVTVKSEPVMENHAKLLHTADQRTMLSMVMLINVMVANYAHQEPSQTQILTLAE